MDIPNWDFIGTTMIASSYVRLTPDRQSKQGGLWNKMVNDIACTSENITHHCSQLKCTIGKC